MNVVPHLGTLHQVNTKFPNTLILESYGMNAAREGPGQFKGANSPRSNCGCWDGTAHDTSRANKSSGN